MIKDHSAFNNAAWNWDFLRPCFREAGPRFAVSDLDGIVERNGRFLVLETKGRDASLPDGQLRTLEALARVPGFTVVILWGQPEAPQAMRLLPGPVQPCALRDLLALVRAWFLSADSMSGPSMWRPGEDDPPPP